MKEKRSEDMQAGQWCLNDHGRLTLALSENCFVLKTDVRGYLITQYRPGLVFTVIDNDLGWDWTPPKKWAPATAETPAWTKCLMWDHAGQRHDSMFIAFDTRECETDYRFLCVASDNPNKTVWVKHCEVEVEA